eukprot:FR736261.1.p2 GENE.FR736261.1~~FR736261.1.p2  ORF type:complete len:171 (+),score=0.05 FR736261.1:121-633(+)
MGGHNRESSNNVLLAEKQELFTPRLPTDMDEPVPLFPEIRSHINMTTAVEVSIGPKITIESAEVHRGLFEDGSGPPSMEETAHDTAAGPMSSKRGSVANQLSSITGISEQTMSLSSSILGEIEGLEEGAAKDTGPGLTGFLSQKRRSSGQIEDRGGTWYSERVMRPSLAI